MGIPQKHILVVDDSEDDRVMFAQYLTRQGYRVSKARDGREGLIKAAEFQPHLILMDLWLPVMSGWDVIKRLKADERTKSIPILVVTGHSAVRPKECEAVLLKPCSLDLLGAEIASILESHDKGTGLSPPPKTLPPPEGQA